MKWPFLNDDDEVGLGFISSSRIMHIEIDADECGWRYLYGLYTDNASDGVLFT